MLQFKQDDTAAVLILTLTEFVSLNDPYFLFVFTHVLTKLQVKFIEPSGADQSAFRYRYNQFTINPSVNFLSAPIGEYHYKVYEQADALNTDETLTGAVLEFGKLRLTRAIEFSFSKYNDPTAFKTYNG